MRSMTKVRSTVALFRRRLTSRSDVKCAQRTGHSQNRALMRGGRT
jgi:hypothetical protein